MVKFEISIKFNGTVKDAQDIENYLLSLFESWDKNLPEPLIDNKDIQLVNLDTNEII